MNYTLLSLEQSPPLSVPLRFFLTAPLFAVAAIIVLLFEPQSFASRWSQPMLAATHFITLGFAGMMMFGALQQLLPVLLGVNTACAKGSSRVLHGLLSAGTAALGMGFILQWSSLQLVALLLLVTAVLLLLFVVMRAVSLTSSKHHSVQGIGGAAIALTVTAGLGGYLLSGYAIPSFSVNRNLTEMHQIWGLLGWIGSLIMATAYQVVPMFQITPEYPKPISRWLIWLLMSGLVIWSIAVLSLTKDSLAAKLLMWLGGALLAAVLGIFVLATLWLQSRRRRRLPDMTLNFWRVGMLSLLSVIPVWLLAQIWPQLFFDRDILLGVLFLVGFAMSVINGMAYKIVPFLIWLHLHNWLQSHGHWQGRVPNVKQVISERRSRIHFYLHTSGLALLIIATWLPSVFLYTALLLLLAANLVLLGNMVLATRLYQKTAAEVVKAAESAAV